MAVQFHFFAPKTLGSATIGAGALTGGGTIYWYQMPRTWKELLTKEGFIFLSSDGDYKGMFHDQKSNSEWTKENDLQDSQDSTVKDKAEKYCKKKLETTLPSSSDANYSTTKQNLISFCTSEGIKTVKARLIQSNKSGWIENDKADDKWKTVFAIYKYDNKFIEWLKEGEGNDGLNKDSKVSENFSKLKTQCSTLLAKSHKELTDDKYFSYASWWCTDLGYTKVDDKIKQDKNWQRETNGENIKKIWKHTESVTDQIKKDLGKTELQGTEYSTWCENQLQKELKEDDYYQTIYFMFKSVCKKTSSK